MCNTNTQHRTRGVPGQSSKNISFDKVFSKTLMIVFMSLMSLLSQAQLSITSSPYSQNFDGLGTSSITVAGGNLNTHSSTLNGWYFVETGSNANTTITVGTGSGTGGDSYNFGASGNSNRKIGGLQSGSLIPTFGFYFTNNTGSTITSIDISYTGETWRVGTASRSDRLDFQYSTNATSLTTGTWTDVNGLDYANPGQATGSGSVQHSASISSSITGLSLTNGSSMFIRWNDFNATGSDDGMAVENFSMTLNSSSNPVVSSSTIPSLFITTALNTNSTEQSFTVSGINLTADITVTAPSDYQVSLTPGGPYNNSVNITNGGTVTNQPVYVVFNPNSLADQGTSGNFVVTTSGGNTVNLTTSGEVTNLSAGALAFIAFQGSTPDIFRMVALQDIPEGTRVYLTDKSWDGSLGTPAFTSGEGSGIWTAPSGGVARGTVIAFNADAGTADIGTGGLLSGLGSTGEQLFAYQGSITIPTFIAGFTTGSTIASGSPSGTQTWVPAGLTDGTNYMALANNVGASSLNVAANIRTLTDHRSFIHNSANWTTATSGSWPSWTFTFLANQPTSQPSFTAASSISNNEITLNFSGGDGTSYIVVMREGSAVTAVPEDGTSYTAISSSANFSTAQEISPGQRIVYNGTISNTDVEVTNLSPGTTYHYAIYAYNGTTSGDRENYLTSSPGTGTESTTGSANSNASDIIAHASFIEPSDIAYATYQENTNLTDVNSLEVAKFTLRDGGASNNDGDGHTTTLNAITFNISNNSVLRRVALYNGSTELAEANVTGSSITFNGLTLIASDDNNVDFSLRVSFQDLVTDNTQFSFTINSVTADIAGSTFAAVDAGGAVSSTTGDRNRIEVTASELAYVQQPTTVQINTAMTPAVTVEAIDALDNRDLDYVTDMTVSATGATLSGTNTVTPVAGLATFSNIQFSNAATGVTLDVSSGSLTNTGNSNSFNTNDPLGPGDITIIGYNTSASPDNFAILVLRDLTEGMTFYVNDNEVASPGTSFTDLSEVEASFTVKIGQTIPAGTVIVLPWGAAAVSTTTYDWSTTSGAGFGNNNEEIYIYTASSISATTPTAFIHYTRIGTSTSTTVPSGLTAGTTYNSISGSAMRYNTSGATYTGCKELLLSSVGNSANWSSTSSLAAGDWTFSVLSQCGPTASVISNGTGSSTICSGASANLKVDITGGISPYTVVISDGTTSSTFTGYTSGSDMSVSPTSNSTYTIVSVTDANSGVGAGNSGSAVVTVNANTIPTSTGTYSATFNHSDGLSILYADNSCNIVANVQDAVGGNVLGSTSVSSDKTSAILVANNNLGYVPRVYTITPSSNGAATVTMYYTQADFDTYNSGNGTQLDIATGPSDATGIGNIRLRVATGGNINAGTLTNYTPSVSWNATDSRWEVTSTLTDMGMLYLYGEPTCATAITNIVSSNITPTSVQLDWDNAGVSSYGIRIRVQGSPTWLSNSNSITNTRTFNGLTPNTTYEVQIRAICSSSPQSYGVYYQTLFTTQSLACSAPSGFGQNSVTATSATITWNSVAAANSFSIRFKPNASGVWNNTTSGSNSRTFVGLIPNTLYDVEVRTNCTNFASSYSSYQFTTAASTCTPVTNIAASVITSTSATLNWDNVGTANSYAIRIKPNTSTTWNNTSSSINTRVFNGLQPNTLYDVEIRSNCSGEASSYVAAQFTTSVSTCTPVTNIVISAITTNSATLNWDNVASANSYAIRIKPNNSMVWNNTSSTTNTRVFNGLQSNTLYDVEIRSNCTGEASNYIATQFTTLTVNSKTTSNTVSASIYNFQGKATPQGHQLNWSTLSEDANQGFNVLYSIDGQNFDHLTTVGTKAKNGSSEEMLNYAFLHTSPSDGENYYRLEMVSIEGNQTMYSQIVRLDGSLLAQNHVLVSPNPTRDVVKVSFSSIANQQTVIKIMDMTGRVVKVIQAITQDGDNSIDLNVSELASGMYTLQLFENNKMKHISKIQKQD